MGARVKPVARYEEFPEPELRLKNGPVLVSGVRVARSAWRSASRSFHSRSTIEMVRHD